MTTEPNITPESATLIKIMREALVAQNYSEHTITNRTRDLTTFIERFEAKHKRSFNSGCTSEQIRELQREAYDAGRATATLESELKAFKLFWTIIMKRNSKITVNPAAVPPGKKRRRGKKGEAPQGRHKITLVLNDEEYEYLMRFAKGRSRQAALRRILAEHQTYREVATAQKLLEANRRELKEMLSTHRDEIEGLLIGQLDVTQDEIRAMHAVTLGHTITAVEGAARMARADITPGALFNRGISFVDSPSGKIILAHLGAAAQTVQESEIEPPMQPKDKAA